VVANLAVILVIAVLAKVVVLANLAAHVAVM
jgi:hypothetical protein